MGGGRLPACHAALLVPLLAAERGEALRLHEGVERGPAVLRLQPLAASGSKCMSDPR